jgi:uncharacterized protein (DUF697 family)
MAWMESLREAASGGSGKSPLEREKVAADIVTMASMGSAAVTYAPIPLSDFVLVTPVQASMVMAVARVYGRELDFNESKHILLELASVCGLSLLAQKGFATLSKVLFPGLGGVLAGPYAFAVTYGMGRVSMRYFEDREHSRESLKHIFDEATKEAKGLFSSKRLEAWRNKWGKDVESFARSKADKGPAKRRKAAPRRATRSRKPAP